MATTAATTTDLIDYDVSWDDILHNVELSYVAVTKVTEEYYTGRYIIISNLTHIKYVINQQNKMCCNHAVPNQNCSINTTKMNYILVFHRWAVFAVKYSGAEYDTASATAFDCDWVYSIIEK